MAIRLTNQIAQCGIDRLIEKGKTNIFNHFLVALEYSKYKQLLWQK